MNNDSLTTTFTVTLPTSTVSHSLTEGPPPPLSHGFLQNEFGMWIEIVLYVAQFWSPVSGATIALVSQLDCEDSLWDRNMPRAFHPTGIAPGGSQILGVVCWQVFVVGLFALVSATIAKLVDRYVSEQQRARGGGLLLGGEEEIPAWLINNCQGLRARQVADVSILRHPSNVVVNLILAAYPGFCLIGVGLLLKAGLTNKILGAVWVLVLLILPFACGYFVRKSLVVNEYANVRDWFGPRPHPVALNLLYGENGDWVDTTNGVGWLFKWQGLVRDYSTNMAPEGLVILNMAFFVSVALAAQNCEDATGGVLAMQLILVLFLIRRAPYRTRRDQRLTEFVHVVCVACLVVLMIFRYTGMEPPKSTVTNMLFTLVWLVLIRGMLLVLAEMMLFAQGHRAIIQWDQWRLIAEAAKDYQSGGRRCGLAADPDAEEGGDPGSLKSRTEKMKRMNAGSVSQGAMSRFQSTVTDGPLPVQRKDSLGAQTEGETDAILAHIPRFASMPDGLNGNRQDTTFTDTTPIPNTRSVRFADEVPSIVSSNEAKNAGRDPNASAHGKESEDTDSDSVISDGGMGVDVRWTTSVISRAAPNESPLEPAAAAPSESSDPGLPGDQAHVSPHRRLQTPLRVRPRTLSPVVDPLRVTALVSPVISQSGSPRRTAPKSTPYLPRPVLPTSPVFRSSPPPVVHTVYPPRSSRSPLREVPMLGRPLPRSQTFRLPRHSRSPSPPSFPCEPCVDVHHTMQMQRRALPARSALPRHSVSPPSPARRRPQAAHASSMGFDTDGLDVPLLSSSTLPRTRQLEPPRSFCRGRNGASALPSNAAYHIIPPTEMLSRVTL
eukprot:Hpha_TRINITY_DN11776_c0_g1::TRINITY_DN11776_c0_g1_i1::g.32088::m.32088